MADTNGLNRRGFLQRTALAAAAGVSLGLVGPVAAAPVPGGHAGHGASANPLNRGWMFFANRLEFDTLAAAAERIFPRDASGPGALDLAVPYFIDNQLAGAYGYNAREYTAGPFFPGAPTQGPQSALLRRDQFRQGLEALNSAAAARFHKTFPRLADAEQDQILTDCEAGKLPTQGFTSAEFFALLKSAVLAGVYADPLYNGNNDMNGWRLKDYPGAQMAYAWLIAGERFEKVPPVGLSSMQGV